MYALVITLKFVAPIFFVVGALHLALGLGADALFGAKIPAEVMANTALDSQNRLILEIFEATPQKET